MINILVRTSNRPNKFKKCIDSILNQTYKNFKIICCYDEVKSKKYISEVKDKRFVSHYINLDNCFHYKYNLYCNFLLDNVKSGWVLFLDDDDMLASNKSLETIMKQTNNKNNLIFWKVLIKDKEIYPKNLNNIRRGEINTSGFCFHSSFKNYSKWKCERASDYLFIKTLQQKVKFNNVFINKQFTKTQNSPNNGKKYKYKNLQDFDIEYACFYSKKEQYLNYKILDGNYNKPCLFVGIHNNKIINLINKYKGYTYVLIENEKDLIKTKDIRKNKNIKILLSSDIDQRYYTYLLHKKICLIHYDIITQQ